nr:hypothetical protein [Tolivirales sp.]
MPNEVNPKRRASTLRQSSPAKAWRTIRAANVSATPVKQENFIIPMPPNPSPNPDSRIYLTPCLTCIALRASLIKLKSSVLTISTLVENISTLSMPVECPMQQSPVQRQDSFEVLSRCSSLGSLNNQST